MVHLFPYLEAGNQYELMDLNLSWKQGLWPDEATGTVKVDCYMKMEIYMKGNGGGTDNKVRVEC